ncbi:BNR-4 repeat-containing protein [Streptomyces tuirus]|uniref:BNR-4 repeat-containing protein n=1 Tax=Streptomyces tuirus TaxID=68278 RepID=A0A941FB57_9ACTN|nr:BNR-4 repeat-containing protein [Streptomyces tuirus]
MAKPLTVNDNGAWCWFQDERALVDPRTQTLVSGSVAAPEGPGGSHRAGNIELAVVDLATGTSDIVVLHHNLEADDHNVPALWRRADGRWLAAYTKHKTDNLLRWRISAPGDPRAWGPEQTFDWGKLNGGSGVTYTNLLALDGRLYCFSRAVNDDPCALISDDDGDTWAYAGKLFTRPKVGYVNGYTRYAQGPDRIDLITTDHHPRDFDNSIYHGYLRAGALHRTDGSVLHAPVPGESAPSQEGLTTLLDANSSWAGERMTHCWTTDLRRTPDGTLAAVVTARANDDPTPAEVTLGRNRPIADLRFFYARLPAGGSWQVHQLAKAGPGLLPHEQDYTGLAAIDPYDPDSLYLSTAIDPRDHRALPHREIFHGRTDDGGATWAWTPVTEDSGRDNLRPVVAPGDPGRIPLLWFRGTMTASQHYVCETVLLDLPRHPTGPGV